MEINYTGFTEEWLGDVPAWQVEGELVKEKNGETVVERFYYRFPQDTFEHRVAEYGYDPQDTATLLDIVLAEAFLTEADFAPGESLADAPTRDAARAAHTARCAQAKLRVRQRTGGVVGVRAALKAKDGPNPLAGLVERSPMDQDAIEIKRLAVDRARSRHSRERLERGERRRSETNRVEGLLREMDPRPIEEITDPELRRLLLNIQRRKEGK